MAPQRGIFVKRLASSSSYPNEKVLATIKAEILMRLKNPMHNLPKPPAATAYHGVQQGRQKIISRMPRIRTLGTAIWFPSGRTLLKKRNIAAAKSLPAVRISLTCFRKQGRWEQYVLLGHCSFSGSAWERTGTQALPAVERVGIAGAAIESRQSLESSAVPCRAWNRVYGIAPGPASQVPVFNPKFPSISIFADYL